MNTETLLEIVILVALVAGAAALIIRMFLHARKRLALQPAQVLLRRRY